MPTILELAESFSSHRFDEVYDHLADDVRWVLPGEASLEGRDAVVAACEGTSGELTGVTTHVIRFVSVGDATRAAVDVVARYVAADGSTTVVSSADIYELDEAGRIAVITSYAVDIGED